MDLFGTEEILGIADLGGDSFSSFGFPDVSDFVGGLGDTVGTAGSLLGLAKKASGALSGVLGGGGGGGSGEMGGSSTGFVNPALVEAQRFQTGQIARQAAEREKSTPGRKGNFYSDAIIREMFKRNPEGLRAFGSQLAAVASKSGSRAELRKAK